MGNEKAITYCGTKLVMWLGTLGLIVGAILGLVTGLAHNGWFILIFFVLAGFAWAVYDTVFKVILLDHFKDEHASVAFAAAVMQSYIGQAVYYFMDDVIHPSLAYKVKGFCIIAFAMLLMPALYLADWRKQVSSRVEQ